MSKTERDSMTSITASNAKPNIYGIVSYLVMHSGSIAPHWAELVTSLHIIRRYLRSYLLEMLNSLFILSHLLVLDWVRWRLHVVGRVGVYLGKHVWLWYWACRFEDINLYQGSFLCCKASE
jgi:hypothetical protein